MADKDVRTLGYVLRRTNYGEADRILNLITPVGKLAVMARGVRKSRSKLAGGIEMFTLADVNVNRGRGTLGVLTGAKMVRHYSEIVKDLAKMELAAGFLRRVDKAAESSDNPEYFSIVDQSLVALNAGEDLRLVEAWFLLNLMRATGEEVNLYRDARGERLMVERRYGWDGMEMAFSEDARGEYGANEIKMLRIAMTAELMVVRRIKADDEMVAKVLRLARTVARV